MLETLESLIQVCSNRADCALPWSSERQRWQDKVRDFYAQKVLFEGDTEI